MALAPAASANPFLARLTGHLGSFDARKHTEDAIDLVGRQTGPVICHQDQRALSLTGQLDADPASGVKWRRW